MSVINREELLTLVGTHGRPRLSLLLPTHRHAPGDSAQDPIRFRNLVRKARGLLAAGSTEEGLSSILSPVEALDEPAFWRGQLEGLAVYSAPGTFRQYSLPMPVPELCVVADSFHVRPLVRFLQANRRYFVLVLGQKGVRLWEGTSFGLGPWMSPASRSLSRMCSARPPVQVSRRTRPVTRRSTTAVADPGKGANRRSNASSARWTGCWPALRDERAPLVLAGPQAWLPLCRESGRYSFTLAEGVTGSFVPERVGREPPRGGLARRAGRVRGGRAKAPRRLRPRRGLVARDGRPHRVREGGREGSRPPALRPERPLPLREPRPGDRRRRPPRPPGRKRRRRRSGRHRRSGDRAWR